MFALAGASALDAATSFGKQEGNSLLASPNGTFGAKGLGLKAGIAASVLVPEILLRRHRNLRGPLTAVNFGDAAFFSVIAAHNLRIPIANN